MATLAMSQPPLNPIFREAGIDNMRSQDQGIALPSIRQAIPELHLTTPSSEMRSRYSVGASPTDYIHTQDQKRRRISDEEERDSLKSSVVPRLYRSPEQPPSRHVSPHHQTSPHFAHEAYNPRSSQPSNVQILNQNSRQSLPSLYDFSASVGVEAKRSPPMKRPAPEMDDYRRHDEMARRSYDYGYAHTPSHYHAASPSSSRMYERPMTSSSNYATHYHDGGRYGELGIMAMGNDTKLRKRRGNLPKETTDKLRSWFVAHLQHPYPTEDEKQELMRQTGLQMNQISNWFINARRRQLPAMINNARAETDAMNGGVPSSSTPSHMSHGTLSDGEGDGYDDVRGMRRHHGDGKRESV